MREQQQLQHRKEIKQLRALLRRARAATQSGGAAGATNEEVASAARTSNDRVQRAKKRSLQLNRKCQGKARCWCEACGDLSGDHQGYVHCFHCQCESHPNMQCEFDPSTIKGQKSGWFW